MCILVSGRMVLLCSLKRGENAAVCMRRQSATLDTNCPPIYELEVTGLDGVLSG